MNLPLYLPKLRVEMNGVCFKNGFKLWIVLLNAVYDRQNAAN